MAAMSKAVLVFLLCVGIGVAVGGIVLAIVIAVIRRKRQIQRLVYCKHRLLYTEVGMLIIL